MSNIYFSSDFHYGHKNIVGPNVSSWSSGYRDFDSIEHMNNTIVDSINNTVGENDVLYYLGDWAFGSEKNIVELSDRLNVREIHFIMGNHDKNIRKYNTHFTSIYDYKEIKIEGQSIILFHFPIWEWHKCHRGSWHLTGHSHGNCEYSHPKTSKYKIMDIGWDIFRKPLSFQEIRKIMNQKEIKGHH